MSPPGRPGLAGVPTDHEAQVADELKDVFAAIDAIEQETRRIRAEAEVRAERGREASEATAERILADAIRGAEQVRADAAAEHRRDLDEDVAATLERARAAAEDVVVRAHARLDAIAGEVVSRVLDSRPVDEKAAR